METTKTRWNVAPGWIFMLVLLALMLTACGSSTAADEKRTLVGTWSYNGHVMKFTTDGLVFLDEEPLGNYQLTDSEYILTVGKDITSFPYTLTNDTFTFTKSDGTQTTYTRVNTNSGLTDRERERLLSLTLD